MFSNIEVENPTEIQELHEINPSRQIENDVRPQSIPNSTNQSSNSDFIGNGVITVSI